MGAVDMAGSLYRSTCISVTMNIIIIYLCINWASVQVMLLMRNLSINLTSPDFEDHVSAMFT